MKAALIWLLIILPVSLFSQFADMPALENNLLQRYKQIERFTRDQPDSIAVYSDIFTNSMNTYISKYPESLNYDFTKLKAAGVAINTSDSGNFRVYSWDTYTGGTMYFFRSIYQYKTTTGVKCKVMEPGEGDAGSFCSQVFTLNAPATVYYLVVNNSVFSSKDGAQSVQAFAIQNDTLNDSVKIFKTDQGLANTITIDFDLSTLTGHPERPLKLIEYDAFSQTLTMPVLTAQGQYTNKKKHYYFNGTYFH